MSKNWLTIHQLDNQLSEWQQLKQKYSAPGEGWVRAIRKALNMTVNQMAYRLGVSGSRIKQIEASEVDGAITLNSLNKAAAALNCELVYAFIPKESSSLEMIIDKQIEKIIEEKTRNVEHTMSLEDQKINFQKLKRPMESFRGEFKSSVDKRIWEAASPSRVKKSDKDKMQLRKKLIDKFKKKK